MGHIRGALLIMVGVLLSLAPGVRADSLQLKNGNFIQGKYMGGTERAVQFEVNGKMRMYDVEQILSISFAAASVDGGMPSNSAEAGHGRNAEGCVAAKSSAAGSAAKSQLKSAKMQSTQNGSRVAGKPGTSGGGMGSGEQTAANDLDAGGRLRINLKYLICGRAVRMASQTNRRFASLGIPFGSLSLARSATCAAQTAFFPISL